MKTKTLLLLLTGILLLAVAATYFYYQTFVVIAIKTIDTDVVVKGVSGFNLDDDKLHFGGVAPGSGGTERKIHISYDYDSRISISVKGTIRDFISVSENDFFLPAKQRKDIIFTATIPENTPFGNYTGTITIKFLRP